MTVITINFYWSYELLIVSRHMFGSIARWIHITYRRDSTISLMVSCDLMPNKWKQIGDKSEWIARMLLQLQNTRWNSLSPTYSPTLCSKLYSLWSCLILANNINFSRLFLEHKILFRMKATWINFIADVHQSQAKFSCKTLFIKSHHSDRICFVNLRDFVQTKLILIGKTCRCDSGNRFFFSSTLFLFSVAFVAQ